MEIGIILICIITLVVFKLLRNLDFRRPKDYPPGPSWFIPFIGNSRYLQNLTKKHGGQYKAYEFLSKEFNSPIFSLKLGREDVVVVMTYPLVKEIYSREEFEGRPDTFFLRLRTMGMRLGITSTDGEFWKEQRSFVIRQLRLIGYGKPVMQNLIHDEMCEVLKVLRNTNEKPIWPGGCNLFSTSLINILWKFVTGKKIKRDDARLVKFFDLLEKRSKYFDLCGGLLSQMPWLRFIAPEATGYNLVKDLNSKFLEFFMEIIDEHLKTYSDEKSNDDLVYAFIREMRKHEGQAKSSFTLKQLVIVILDFFLGGALSITPNIDAILMTMLIFPDIQKKCRDEIKNTVEADGQIPSYNDRHKTPYTDAVILEVQRFFGIVPIGGPRRTLKDCMIGNYRIPKNTTVFLGLKNALNDENYWNEPRTFNPERFLNNKINADRFIAYAIGRRNCLGEQLARKFLYTFTVGILNEFSLLKTQNEDEFPSIDLVPGIFQTTKPYKIIFKSNK